MFVYLDQGLYCGFLTASEQECLSLWQTCESGWSSGARHSLEKERSFAKGRSFAMGRSFAKRYSCRPVSRQLLTRIHLEQPSETCRLVVAQGPNFGHRPEWAHRPECRLLWEDMSVGGMAEGHNQERGGNHWQ